MPLVLTFLRTLAFTAALGAASLHAQSLVHAYYFTGNLNDSVGSTTLTASNSPSASGTGSLTTTSDYYTFGPGQGLGFVGETGLRTEYTIALRFSFDTVTSYRRIINFENSFSDSGQYVLGGAFNFYLNQGTGGSITAGTSVDFILTRNSSGFVSAYQGTTLIFSFQDTNSYAVASSVSNQSTFSFFRDDGGENSAGRVDSLLFYNGAVTSTQISSGMVTSALTAIPESATVAAWMGAAGLIGAVVWRRSRRA